MYLRYQSHNPTWAAERGRIDAYRATHPGTTEYRNTVLALFMVPPSGSMAEAWDLLLAEHPELDGARICDSAGHFDIELERTMGTAAHRTDVVRAIASAHAADVAVGNWDPDWATTWARFTYAGETVILHTKVCTCHPDNAKES